MDNPTRDGQSKDYYPERYTGFGDNGGVHLNSGIANLAFYLASQGGRHPRNKTNVEVTGVGIEKARNVWFAALTQYMTASTNFQGARAATKTAAETLYPSDPAVALAFQQAWDAVGAPGGGTTPPPPPPSGDTPLSNGVPVSNLSGAQGTMLYYKITVPTGGTNLTVQMSGGTGDADVYVKFGQRPTTSSWDYRPYLNGNNETVNVGTNTRAGDYFIMIRAYTAFSGVTLRATYTGGTEPPPPPPPPPSNTQTWPNLSGATGSKKNFTFSVPTNARSVRFTLAGGDPDADLQVSSPGWIWWWPQYESESPTNTETIQPTFKAGTWKITVYGYETYSGATLTATYSL
jgi:vibriolysin